MCIFNKRDNKYESCINYYYYVLQYLIFSPIERWQTLKDANTYEQNEDYFCLDLRKGKCYINWDMVNEEKLFYFRCKGTNKEGTKCKICGDDFILDENGM